VVKNLSKSWPKGTVLEALNEAGLNDPELLLSVAKRIVEARLMETPDSTVGGLIQAVNDSHPDYNLKQLAQLDKAVKGWTVFIKGDAHEPINKAASLKVLAAAAKNGGRVSPIDGQSPVTIWEAVRVPQKCHPVTGEVLPLDSDWHKVSDDRLLFVAFLASMGVRDIINMPDYQLRKEARKPKIKGTVFEGWADVYERAKKRTPPDRTLFEAETALYKQPWNIPTISKRGVSVGNVSGTGIAIGSGARAVITGGADLVLGDKVEGDKIVVKGAYNVVAGGNIVVGNNNSVVNTGGGTAIGSVGGNVTITRPTVTEPRTFNEAVDRLAKLTIQKKGLPHSQVVAIDEYIVVLKEKWDIF